MATGFLTPDARLRVFSDVGVLPGAKLNTYVAGTPATPLATYSDSALTVPNTNPVVASAGGLFGPIYLTPGVAYKLVLTDAAGVVIWTQDNVMVPSVVFAAGAGISLATVAGTTTITATSGVGSIGGNDFRLTLESGVPVSSTDQLAKTTLYCTPTTGTRLDLYDAAGVPTTLASAQFSIALPAAASQLYSVFAYNTAGVPTLELTAWTNDTTPGPAAYGLSATTGTRTKTGDLTRRFLGLVRTTTVAGQSEDSNAKRFLWNDANRVPKMLERRETTASWIYTVAAFRIARASAVNQVEYVIGAQDVLLDLGLSVGAGNASSAVMVIAIGHDSVTVPHPSCVGAEMYPTGSPIATGRSTLKLYPAIGYHYAAWLEYAAATGTATWYSTNTLTAAAGLTGRIEG